MTLLLNDLPKRCLRSRPVILRISLAQDSRPAGLQDLSAAGILAQSEIAVQRLRAAGGFERLIEVENGLAKPEGLAEAADGHVFFSLHVEHGDEPCDLEDVVHSPRKL